MKGLHTLALLSFFGSFLCSIAAKQAKNQPRNNNEVTTKEVEIRTNSTTVVPESKGQWDWIWSYNSHDDKSQQKVSDGEQKMANCRHLSNSSTLHHHQHSSSTLFSSTRLSRLWRKMVQRYGSSPPANARDYTMAVLATLSYWDFHKKALPDNRSSFELMTLRQGTPKPLRRRRKRDTALNMVLSAMRAALEKAQPWTFPFPKRGSPNNATGDRNRPRRKGYRYRLERKLRQKLSSRQTRHRIQLEYFFYNWYEPTPLGNYHDTDLLIATSNNGRTLIIAFAGTASVPDTVTNLQTFESVQHAGLFHHNHTALKGSIHRGFLNAYSRVERGSVLRLCDDGNCTLSALHRRYSHCTAETSQTEAAIPTDQDFDQYDIEVEKQKDFHIDTASSRHTPPEPGQQEESIVRKRGRRGCKIKNKKLMTILRELVVEYLTTPGRSVLLSGHSLGGSLATLHALDIIFNFPNVPVNRLELWTFGGVQVSDDAFLESALAVQPRLQHFLQSEQRPLQSLMTYVGGSEKGGSRFHRFVTVSDDCRVDFVSTVAQKTLSPDNEKNIHGKTARKLGGILGTSVVHLTEPHYLLTPDQYDVSILDDNIKQDHGSSSATAGSTFAKDMNNKHAPSSASTTTAVPANKPSSTRSTLAAHSISNYLKGISRESKDHPLSTDLPEEVRSFLGEISWQTAS